MRLRDALRTLDRRILPPVGAALARLGRGARRLRLLTAAGVTLSVAAVLVAVYAAGRTPPVTGAPISADIRMGVPEGGSIPRYVARTRADLSALVASTAGVTPEPKYFALVSMSSYLTPAQATAVFAGLPIRITDVVMRVPADAQTQIITFYVADLPADIVRGMQATAARKRQEAADDGTLRAKVPGDSTTATTLRAQYAQEAQVASLEASAYGRLCACVYAAVVYATPADLGALAGRRHVRAIETAPKDQTMDRAVFLPPLPDQRRTAEPPGPPPPGTAPSTASVPPA